MRTSGAMKLLRLFGFGILVTATSVSAQSNSEGLTLNDCIELALHNRASVIAARGDEEIAKADRTAALGAFLPRVSASFGYYEQKQRDQKVQFEGGAEQEQPDQDGDGTDLQLSANLTILDLSNFADYASAKSSREAARLSVLDSEQALIYAVKLAYFAYLANMQNVEVQTEAVKRSEEQLKLIQSRYDLGSAALSDVLKQKVQVGNDLLAMLRANNLVTTSRANLAYTIGLDPNSETGFSNEYSEREYDGTLEDALSFGLEHEPGLLALEQNLRAAGSSLAGRRYSYLPTASVYGRYNVSDGSQGDTLLFNFSSKTLTYGIEATWSIFDGFLRERNVTAARVARNNAEARLADERNYVVQNIKSAYYEIQQQRQAREVAGENVAAAEEDLKITREKYNLGAATILDLLNAQVSLIQAQVSQIQAQFDLNLAIAQLENAMGKM